MFEKFKKSFGRKNNLEEKSNYAGNHDLQGYYFVTSEELRNIQGEWEEVYFGDNSEPALGKFKEKDPEEGSFIFYFVRRPDDFDWSREISSVFKIFSNEGYEQKLNEWKEYFSRRGLSGSELEENVKNIGSSMYKIYQKESGEYVIPSEVTSFTHLDNKKIIQFMEQPILPLYHQMHASGPEAHKDFMDWVKWNSPRNKLHLRQAMKKSFGGGSLKSAPYLENSREWIIDHKEEIEMYKIIHSLKNSEIPIKVIDSTMKKCKERRDKE